MPVESPEREAVIPAPFDIPDDLGKLREEFETRSNPEDRDFVDIIEFADALFRTLKEAYRKDYFDHILSEHIKHAGQIQNHMMWLLSEIISKVDCFAREDKDIGKIIYVNFPQAKLALEVTSEHAPMEAESSELYKMFYSNLDTRNAQSARALSKDYLPLHEITDQPQAWLKEIYDKKILGKLRASECAAKRIGYSFRPPINNPEPT